MGEDSILKPQPYTSDIFQCSVIYYLEVSLTPRMSSIAVVDAATHLLHFSRMPNAKITGINIAVDKVFTAAGHKLARIHTKKQCGQEEPLMVWGIAIEGVSRRLAAACQF
jgi:hypothetical protein